MKTARSSPSGAQGRLLVDGRVQIVVDAWDQVNGNERRRRLGLYRFGYQVLNVDGSPVAGFEEPQETIRFDRLAFDDDAARDVYASGSGIPFFGRRSTRFLYSVTSTLREGVSSPGVWDTSTLPPGNYTLRILAADIEGNQALANRDVPVTVGPALPVQATSHRPVAAWLVGGDPAQNENGRHLWPAVPVLRTV